MKRITIVVLTLIGGIATAGTSQVNRAAEQKHLMIATPEGPNIGLTAANIEREQPAWHLLRLKGNVEIRTKDMIVHTDEAVYNEETGEINAPGAVLIKLETQK